MDLLMNGEIFIKRGPEIIKYDKEKHEENKKRTEKLRNEMLNDPSAPSAFLNAMFTLSKVEKIVDEAYDKPTYAGCDSFWTLFLSDKGIEMNEREVSIEEPNPGITSKRLFNTEEEVDSRFISLADFLDNAEFVGKRFKASAKKQIDMYTKSILLYKTNDIWLTYEKNRLLGTEGFFIRSRRPGIERLNYKTYGRTHKEFKDKSEVYFSIFKQLTKDQGLIFKK